MSAGFAFSQSDTWPTVQSDNWEKIRDGLVEEGKRIKKNPWTCDSSLQYEVSLILMLYDIWEYESQEETLARYAKEKTA